MSCDSRERAFAARIAPVVAASLGCSETDARDLILELRELASSQAAARPDESVIQRWEKVRRKAEDARATEACASVFRSMQAMDPPIAPPSHSDPDPQHGVPLPTNLSDRHGWQAVGELLDAARSGSHLPSLAYEIRTGQLARAIAAPAAPSPDLADVRAMRPHNQPRVYALMAMVLAGDAQREAVCGVAQSSHGMVDKQNLIAAILPYLTDWSADERDALVGVALAAARSHSPSFNRLPTMSAIFGCLSGTERDRAFNEILADVSASNITVGESMGEQFQLSGSIASDPACASVQANTLAYIAPHLKAEEARRALAVANASIRGDKDQLYAVVALAARLPEDERAAVYAQQRITTRCRRCVTDLLWEPSRIAPFLAAYGEGAGFDTARALVEQIPAATGPAIGTRVAALTALIPLAPAERRAAALTAAMTEIHAVAAPTSRADGIIGLLPHAPAAWRPQMAAEALQTLRSETITLFGSHQIGQLLPYLPPALDDEVLAALRTAEPRAHRPFFLATLAAHRQAADPAFARQVRDEALRMARRIRQPDERGMAMAMLRRTLHAQGAA